MVGPACLLAACRLLASCVDVCEHACVGPTRWYHADLQVPTTSGWTIGVGIALCAPWSLTLRKP
jgi:hypothetical protein|eukprot:COSAG01_NODE_2076_length_8486_cov_41.323000_8_plen_64_part_00